MITLTNIRWKKHHAVLWHNIFLQCWDQGTLLGDSRDECSKSLLGSRRQWLCWKKQQPTKLINGLMQVNVIATIPGIWAVDKVGRRTMLICGAAMMFACEVSNSSQLFYPDSQQQAVCPNSSCGDQFFDACYYKLIVACVGTFTAADNVVSQKVLVAFSCIFIGIFAATWGEQDFPTLRAFLW